MGCRPGQRQACACQGMSPLGSFSKLNAMLSQAQQWMRPVSRRYRQNRLCEPIALTTDNEDNEGNIIRILRGSERRVIGPFIGRLYRQVFLMQTNGGVSRYFSNLIREFLTDPRPGQRVRCVGSRGVRGVTSKPYGQKLVEITSDPVPHRGPGVSGTWDHNNDRVTTRLGQRRLSISDLSSAADQPSTST